MTITVYSAFGLGVEKTQITAGDGSAQPRITGVISTGPGSVRITFDRSMSVSSSDGGVLDFARYKITRLSDGSDLKVLYAYKQTDTIINLLTEQQYTTSYELSVHDIYDAWGNLIDPLYDTATFSGTGANFGYPANLISMVGVDAGIQRFIESDFIPDVSIPMLTNKVPSDGVTDVGKDTNVSFDIYDLDTGINLSLTQIWIGGVLAFDGATDTFIAPFNGPASAHTPITGGYHFVVDKNVSYGSYLWTSVRLVTWDNAYLPNPLDYTWSFRIIDYVNPEIIGQDPTGVDVIPFAHVSFSLREVGGSGVNLATLQVSIEGAPAISGGTFQSGFLGTHSSVAPNGYNGYDLVIDKESGYGSYKTVYVIGSVQDYTGNLLSFSWSFRIDDYLGPYVDPTYPEDYAINVPIDTNITLEITDDDHLLTNSLIIKIDLGSGFVVAYHQGETPAFKPGFDGPGSSITPIAKGYRVIIDPVADFVYGGSYVVEVTAADPAGNPERKDGPPP